MLDTKYKFSRQTILLHWLIALLVIGMLIFGMVLDSMPRGEEKGQLMMYHKSLGLLIFVLASWRLVWRLLNGTLKPLPTHKPHEILLAHWVHWILLIATILMPLSGVVMSIAGGRPLVFFGLTMGPFDFKSETLGQFAGSAHGIIALVLIVAIGLHVLGALKHVIIDRDDTLARMKGKDLSLK